MNIKPCFGIVSYLPLNQPDREQRQTRLDKLVSRLSELWPDIPIMIIAQQWSNKLLDTFHMSYTLENKCKNKVIRYDYPKLGIINARKTLRERFLESDFNYIIMFDDDALIEGNVDLAKKYVEEMNKHPNGFCFIKGKGSSKFTDYADSQLNMCAISKYIYEKEPLPGVDPQKGEAFEDRIWSTLLHFKYAELEFDAPKGLYHNHFRNTKEPVTSTWSNKEHYNWNKLRSNTHKIECYIAEHKELPKEWKKLI